MDQPDFSAAHAVLRRHHDEHRLSGVSALIFQGSDVVDELCIGEADIEQSQAMRPDHIHRERPNLWASPMRADEPSEAARIACLAGTSA